MSEQPTECPECGSALRTGQRWGGATGPVKVLVCLVPETGEGCGYETPHLYKRNKARRNWNYEYLLLRVGADGEMTTDGR